MSREQISSRRQAEEMLIGKAQQDDAFRAELLANPRAAIERQLGVDFPPDMTFTVVEETGRSFYLVLPSKPASAALSDQELGAVTGGKMREEAAAAGITDGTSSWGKVEGMFGGGSQVNPAANQGQQQQH